MTQFIAGSRPVDQHGGEVHERIAQGRHLPVEDSTDARLDRIDNRIVQAVVAVHDRPRQVSGQPLHARVEPQQQLVDRREIARLGQLPLLPPARDLTREESLRAAEPAQAHLACIDRVQSGEHVDQLSGECGCIRHREALGSRVATDDATCDVLHDEEARADDRLVVAVGEGPRSWEVTPRHATQHGELPTHVVSRRHHMSKGRTSDDKLSIALGDEVGDVGQAPCETDRLHGGVLDQSLRGQPGADGGEVKTLGRCHASDATGP